MKKSIIALCIIAGISNSYAETSDTQLIKCKADIIALIDLSSDARKSGHLCMDHIVKYGKGQPLAECNVATIKFNTVIKYPLNECTSDSMMTTGVLSLSDTYSDKLTENHTIIKEMVSIIKEYNSHGY